MNILLWHVHGSWTTSFVQGLHTYYIPVLPDRGPDGRGRAQTWPWPDSVIEVTPQIMPELKIDVMVLQRPRELSCLAEAWTGRRPGRDVAAVYVEHNAPQGAINEMRHQLATQNAIPLVHVTHFNSLFWDGGSAVCHVIEHGIADPGYRYSGELQRCAVVINEPVRRSRVTGTDLLPILARTAPVDLFGMHVAPLARDRICTYEDLPQEAMLSQIAMRRAYVHPMRWTSLGLSLLEAMYLGMPVVALATTEAFKAVAPGTGFLDTDVRALSNSLESLIKDRALALSMGERARAHVHERYNLPRFLANWDEVLETVVT